MKGDRSQQDPSSEMPATFFGFFVILFKSKIPVGGVWILGLGSWLKENRASDCLTRPYNTV